MLKTHRNNNNNNNNKKYVPPPPRTEKKELKKEFALHQASFPTLSTTPNKRPALSFAHAAQTALVKQPVSESESLLPGWIYIRNNGGKIEYKSGPPRHNSFYKREAEEDARLGRLLLKYRLAKEQYARDNDVLRLGDYSEYYNTPTLQEQFADEDIIMLKADYLSSDSSDFE